MCLVNFSIYCCCSSLLYCISGINLSIDFVMASLVSATAFSSSSMFNDLKTDLDDTYISQLTDQSE